MLTCKSSNCSVHHAPQLRAWLQAVGLEARERDQREQGGHGELLGCKEACCRPQVSQGGGSNNGRENYDQLRGTFSGPQEVPMMAQECARVVDFSADPA